MALHERAAKQQQALSGGLIRRMAVVKPAILAIAFGIFILYGVGFAQPQLLHDAAHDTRHAFAFPCH